MVMTKPPGSRPGINSFAITPTTNPNKIHKSIDMLDLLSPQRGSPDIMQGLFQSWNAAIELSGATIGLDNESG
jgi:hypothetical protein